MGFLSIISFNGMLSLCSSHFAEEEKRGLESCKDLNSAMSFLAEAAWSCNQANLLPDATEY